MMKKNKLRTIIIFVFFIGIVLYLDDLGKESRARVSFTLTTLNHLRVQIAEYHVEYEEYPQDLGILKEYMINLGNHDIIENIFHVDFKQVADFEKYQVDVLNGTGGLYYNNETGDIRVNLDKPVKYYVKLSPIKRNEIPIEW